MSKKERRSVPVLRFKGFTDDWEQRKFSDIAQRISTNININLPNVTYDDIDSENETLNKGIKNLSSGKKGILFQKNDILFGKLRPYLNNIIKVDFKGIAVGDFWVLRAYEDSSFLFSLINTPQYKYIANISSGSKMPRSDWNLVSKYLFCIPSEKEQSHIGNLILKLSQLITLQQRKLKLIKVELSAILQQLLSQKSTWPNYKLSQVVSIQDNKRVPVKRQDRISGPIPYYGANGVQDYVDGYTHKGDLILIAEDGANSLTNYPIYFVNGKIWANNHTHVLRPNKEVNPLFLTVTLKQINYSKYVVGGSRYKLNLEDLKSIKLNIPNRAQQDKIGGIYNKFYQVQLKENHKLKLQHKIKHFLLQNMFI